MKIREAVAESDKLLTRNRIFMDRMENTGVISRADAAAYGWLRLVERQCRMIDPTLGGVCQLTGCVLTSSDSQGYTDPTKAALGRGCEIIATFTASDVRISA